MLKEKLEFFQCILAENWNILHIETWKKMITFSQQEMSVLDYRTTKILHFYWVFFEMQLCKCWLMVRERHSANITSAFYPIYCRCDSKFPQTNSTCGNPNSVEQRQLGSHIFYFMESFNQQQKYFIRFGKRVSIKHALDYQNWEHLHVFRF